MNIVRLHDKNNCTEQKTMEEVLSHHLGPLPWVLATSDGSIRKASEPVKTLQKNIPTMYLPDETTCLIDDMAMIQKMQGIHKTFADHPVSRDDCWV